MTSEDADKDARRRTRELALAVAAGFFMRERRTARTLLRAERRALSQLRRAVASVLAATHAETGDTRAALAMIRRTAPRLAHALEHAIASTRADARAVARGTVLREIGSAVLHPLDGRAEHDRTSAHAAASSYASAWATRATASVLSETPAEGRHPYRTSARDPRLERIAATETANAFNDERRRMLAHLESASFFKVWSAVLDRVTCRYCFARDGEVRSLQESFGTTPPVHPNCRCVIELVHVPKPERLDDRQIDYALFKSSLRDVIRERREVSGRHARQFIDESMGADRSPVALTKRYAAGVGER